MSYCFLISLPFCVLGHAYLTVDDVHSQSIVEHSGVSWDVCLRCQVLNHLLKLAVLTIVHVLVNLLSILFDHQLHRGLKFALWVDLEHLVLLWLCLSATVDESAVYKRHQLLPYSDYVHLNLSVEKRDLSVLDVQRSCFWAFKGSLLNRALVLNLSLLLDICIMLLIRRLRIRVVLWRSWSSSLIDNSKSSPWLFSELNELLLSILQGCFLCLLRLYPTLRNVLHKLTKSVINSNFLVKCERLDVIESLDDM